MGGICHPETQPAGAWEGFPRWYRLYGLLLRSVLPLPGPESAGSISAPVELYYGSSSLFSRIRRETKITPEKGGWFQHNRLSDGSDYLRWSGLFEFLVSAEGHRIACRALSGASTESFQTYLVGQVLSFALVRRGIEPLHATAVVIDGEAVAFLGDCGFGKSSLGASFLQVGHRLLTDDLLVLKEDGDRFLGHPGLPRIKLFPKIAETVLRQQNKGIPMNNRTTKLVIPLEPHHCCRAAAPLKAIYVLTPPTAGSRNDRIAVRSMSERQAFVALLKNTFNTVIDEPERLKRQFVLATRLAARVPVKALFYPRTLACLPAVREAVRLDIEK